MMTSSQKSKILGKFVGLRFSEDFLHNLPQIFKLRTMGKSKYIDMKLGKGRGL